jgi:hypothetical protein
MSVISANVITEFNKNKVIDLEYYPDTCPICLRGIDPRIKIGYIFDGESKAEIIFQCPRLECRELFIVYYFENVGLYSINHIEPQTYQPREFGEYIL